MAQGLILTSHPGDVRELLPDVVVPEAWTPRYNVAPSQQVAVVAKAPSQLKRLRRVHNCTAALVGAVYAGERSQGGRCGPEPERQGGWAYFFLGSTPSFGVGGRGVGGFGDGDLSGIGIQHLS